jgi:hypothetical protein
MEYKLEIKPFERKDGWKYKIITVTDFALHTADKQPTVSFGKKIRQLLETKKPRRIYGLIQESPSTHEENTSILDMLQKDEEFMKMIQEEEKKGYKILISIPKKGIPIVPGKDTIDFINSKNGQRVIRGLAKNKNKDI